jgi:hypothetical protein
VGKIERLPRLSALEGSDLRRCRYSQFVLNDQLNAHLHIDSRRSNGLLAICAVSDRSNACGVASGECCRFAFKVRFFAFHDETDLGGETRARTRISQMILKSQCNLAERFEVGDSLLCFSLS